MQYRPLGNTDIQVSLICLGSMTWGEQNTEAQGHAQLDLAIDHGVNFIDTAEIYPVPVSARTYGETERIIGSWLHLRGRRDDVILATKAASRADWLPHIRGGNPRLNRKHLEQALHDSLKRLQTDYVDLYQLHWPERKTNFFGDLGYEHDPQDDSIPLEETFAVLEGFVKAGKVRHVGLSNETPWGMMASLRVAEASGLPRVVSVQNPYSLLNRTFEVGASEVALREQVGLLAYSPLGFGVLSGKYLGRPPRGARLSLPIFSEFTRYTNPAGRTATQKYVAVAKKNGLDPAQMALAWVNRQPFTTSTIIGATTPDQLQSNIDSADIMLSDTVLNQIAQIHSEAANPCP